MREPVDPAEHPVQYVAVRTAALGVQLVVSVPQHRQQPRPLLDSGGMPYGGSSSSARAGLVTARASTAL